MKSECIILTGGGTAGHVMPHINLQKEYYKYFKRVIYIGSKDGIEKKLITSNTKFEYKEITTTKLKRKKILANLSIPFKLHLAVKQAKQIIKEVNPSIIFSKGGYVGLPVVIAGKKSNIPIVCHESDFSMGLANKLSKKYADVICTNFEKTALCNGKKCIHTGTPLPVSTLTKQQAKEKLAVKTTKPILLVTGGSLGAKSINDFIFQNVDNLTEKYFIIHLVGKNNFNKKIKNSNYKQIEFSNDMWTIFKACDYAISRAGANTIVELLANNILTIFVPLPKSVSRGDQIENANYLEQKGLCYSIQQDELSLEKVQKSLILLEKHSKNIKNKIKNENFTDGTKRIMDIIISRKK